MEGWLVGELVVNGAHFSELEALSHLVNLKRRFSHALAVRPLEGWRPHAVRPSNVIGVAEALQTH